MSGNTSSFGVDFGQQVDLTASIRNILRNYPEGTAVLKELVQNADDANARKVSICLDCRNHKTENVADIQLQQFQGPSLFAYNDAVFKEEDFKSIQRIGDSLKKMEENQSKIGRFGIGFNAVYHWTDLPSFISSKYLVLLDPQARFLPNVNPSNPGKMVDWISDASILHKFSDQFQPYKGYHGLDFTKPFNGTLFRLPLRTVQQAETSLLSKRALSIEDAMALLLSLRNEASAMLLFLKHVESIEISIWDADMASPRSLYKCEIANITPTLRSLRSFVSQSNSHQKTCISSSSSNSLLLAADYSLDILCQIANNQYSYVENWEVCNQLGGTQANIIAYHPSNKLLRLVPWGGLACCINITVISGSNNNTNCIYSGLAYCFLPLPIQTGLPLMVNGFFELSSNRRDVWQAGTDMTGDGKIRAQWNIALMGDVIAPSYVRLLLRLRDKLGYSEVYQSLFPSSSTISSPWTVIVASTMELCKREKLLSTTNGQWIACQDAVVIPKDNRLDTQKKGDLIAYMTKASQPIVLCSDQLRDALVVYKACGNQATSAYVRQSLRSSDYVPSIELCNFLLEYCLLDYTQTAVAVAVAVAANLSLELNRLPILPLMNGKVGRLCVYSKPQSDAIACIIDMGFSYSQSLWALEQCSFSVKEACDLLTSIVDTSNASTSPAAIDTCAIYILVEQDEAVVFTKAASILLDKSRIGPSEVDFLMSANMATVSNVRLFHAALVLDLVRQILPLPFHAGTIVRRSALSTDVFDECISFLTLFWKFSSLRPDIISAISNGPAVVPTIHLESFLPLSRLSNLIIDDKSTDNVGVSVVLQDIFALLDINIVHPLSSPDGSSSMPSSYWHYVNEPTRAGILKAIDYGIRSNATTAVKGSHGVTIRNLSDEQIDELRHHLCSCEPVRSISKADIDILVKLPIFKTFNTASTYVQLNAALGSGHEFVTIADSSKLPSVLFPIHYIDTCNNQMELDVLSKLNVKKYKRCQYFRLDILPNVAQLYASHPKETETVLLEMLMELKSLIHDDAEFLSYLRDIRFIPCGTSDSHTTATSTITTTTTTASTTLKLCKACDLFDPNSKEDLHKLLDTSFFPTASFQEEGILVILRSIGLQSTLTWPGIITCAASIATTSGNSDMTEPSASVDVNRQRGIMLLRFLDKRIVELMNPEKPKQSGLSIFTSYITTLITDKSNTNVSGIKSPDDYLNELKFISWIPVLTTPTKSYMPWLQVTAASKQVLPSFASAVNTRPGSDIWLCSSTKRLTVEKYVSESLKKYLGWSSMLDVPTVAIQLRELGRLFLQLADKSNSSSTSLGGSDIGCDSCSDLELQEAREMITELIPQLYQHLNTAADEHKLEILSLLESYQWIWVGSTFISHDKVAITSTVNASPYLYQLPQDLQVYRNLLKIFNVKQTFTPRCYVQVLRQMAEITGAIGSAPSSGSSAKSAVPLSEECTDLAVTLATLLSAESSIDPQVYSLYIPDNLGYLGLSTELVNDDIPWLSGSDYSSARMGCRLIHHNISSHVAEKLGVKSLRLTLVSKNAEESYFNSTSSSGGVGSSSSNGIDMANVKAFGQAESLTNRLKTILDLYPDGNPIFSELLQNADDAGASKVCIMLDMNTYPSESLLDSKMKPLQGPSLIVCNDAVFTESDFKSLASIGQGSKLEKLATTGRFGLGFSSTYHITDTPTFVSGEHLVIFDPHCSFAPGACLNQPGLRIKHAGSSLPSTFPDQFQPFRFFGCDFTKAYNGTLFRFPLRTTALARKSEISKRSYSISDVEANLNQFITHLSQHLLFLRSVKCIEIYQCLANEATPTLLHTARSNTFDLQSTNDQSLLSYFDKKHNIHVSPSRDDFYSKLLATPEAKLPITSYKMQIKMQSYSDSRRSDTSGDGGTDEEILYLITSGLCGGEARRLACDSSMRHLKLIPFGSLAACISKNSSTSLYPSITGQAFCFLPLPINPHLPVHVNAYWELSSNRRDIWQGDDTKGVAKLRSEWNMHVMKDVLAPLYRQLLLSAVKLCSVSSANSTTTSQIDRSPVNLLTLLPCPTPLKPWDTISESLLSLIKDDQLLYSRLNNDSLVSISKAVLIECNRSSSTSHSTTEEKLASLLLDEGIPIVEVSSAVLKCLTESNSVGGKVDPNWVRKHYSAGGLSKHAAVSSGAKTREEMYANCIFLLAYCFSDITSDTYSSLIGSPLIPLEDGTVGTFSSAGDEKHTIYLASDIERKLLQKAGSRIVASDAVIGAQVAACIKDGIFPTVCNIKAITSADMIRLLYSFLPLEWRLRDYLTPVNRDGIISNEWLVSLWTYILDFKNNSLLGDDFLPIVPIVSIENNRCVGSGQYLVRISSKIPVLHMSYKEMPLLAASAFADLGIYVFDAAALGGLSYSEEVTAILCQPTVRGVLDAMHCVSHNYKKGSSAWTSETVDSLREFILDTLLCKIDALTDSDVAMLCSLPIWTHFSANSSQTSTDVIAGEYLSIDDPSAVFLPPKGVDARLLGNRYVNIRSERDRPLYNLLRIYEQSTSKFYTDYLLPKATSHEVIYCDAQIDQIAIDVLRVLPTLSLEDNAAIVPVLNSCCIFRNAAGQLKCPTYLFEPKVPLVSILPDVSFPSSKLFYEANILASLVCIGMNTAITGDGVIVAAQTIQFEVERYYSKLTSVGDKKEETLKQSIARASALLKYLEMNIEPLLQSIDPIGYEAATCASETHAGSSVSDNAVGGSWGKELRSLSWIPVLNVPPAKVYDGLPWSERIHMTLLAAPSQCCRLQDAWQCSSTHRICMMELRSDLLLSLLGWNKCVTGRSISMQLLKVKEAYDRNVTAGSSSSSQAEVVHSRLGIEIPKLYTNLNIAYQRESVQERSVWINMLKDKPVYWIDGKFIEYNRLAFQSLKENLSTEPFLYVISGETSLHRGLLKELGVKDVFAATDLSEITRQLYRKCSTNSALILSEKDLTLCVGVVKILVKLLNGEEPDDADDSCDEASRGFDDGATATTAGVDVSEVGIKLNDGSDGSIPTISSKSVTLLELGEVYVPDKNRVLHAAHSLTFDDAPWISATLVQRSSSSGSSSSSSQAMKFVYKAIDNTEACAIGCRSLREQLYAGDRIVCPEANALHAVVQSDNILHTLNDMLSLSDALGMKEMNVIYDERSYATESLMHPGLAETQGPSLIVYLKGPNLSTHLVSQVLTSPHILPSISTADTTNESSTSTSTSVSLVGNKDYSSDGSPMKKKLIGDTDGTALTYPYPSSGKRLMSAFAITDCLQIITGRPSQLYLFDPCGLYLSNDDVINPSVDTTAATASSASVNARKSKGADSSSSTSHKPVAIAQRCLLNERKSSPDAANILQRFPDQFAPFLSLMDNANDIGGIIIRMPIRKAPSVISANITSIGSIKSALKRFKSYLEGSLLFSSSLLTASCIHACTSDDEYLTDYEIRIASPANYRGHKWSLLQDRGWKKSVFSSLFTRAFVPPEVNYRITLSTVLSNLRSYTSSPPLDGSISITSGWLQWDNATLSLKFDVDDVTISDSLKSTQDWLLQSIAGYGRCKDLAVAEPYRSLRLQPVATVAIGIMNRKQLQSLSTPPDEGYLYCGGGAVGSLGLPYHIEGPFLHDFMTRTCPLLSAAAEQAQVAAFQRKVSISMHVGTLVDERRLLLPVLQAWNASILSAVADVLLPKVLLELSSITYRSIGNNNATTTSSSSSSCSSSSNRIAEGYYKYWPYPSRTSKDIALIFKQSNLFQQLAALPTYLLPTGFVDIKQVILPAFYLSDAARLYLQCDIPICLTPKQVSLVLTSCNARFSSLTYSKLRELLKKNPSSDCVKLQDKHGLLLLLLRYCISDIYTPVGIDSASEFSRRRLYKEMAGVPLLPMSDGSIRIFPRNDRERVVHAEYALHALLPTLKRGFIHPSIVQTIPLLSDALFMECLYICKFSMAFLEGNIASVMSSRCHKVDSFEWASGNLNEPATVGRGLRRLPTVPTADMTAGDSRSTANVPSEVLMYVLWKDILGQEQLSSFDSIRDWPMLPVVCNGKRLLLSAGCVRCLFSVYPTELQDQRRNHLQREVGRLTTLEKSSYSGIDSTYASPEVSAEEDWKWIDASATIATSTATPVTTEPPTAVQSSVVVVAAAADVGEFNTDDYDVSGFAITHDTISSDAGTSDSSSGTNTLSSGLLKAMTKLRIPFLDAAIVVRIPRAIEALDGIGIGRRLLECMHHLAVNSIMVYHVDILASADAHSGSSVNYNDASPLLSFNAIDDIDRSAILLEVYKSHRDDSFTATDIDKLKLLPLFSSHDRSHTDGVSIKECTAGVFWCSNDAVLEGIASTQSLIAESSRNSTSTTASSAKVPVILRYDQALLPIYALVGVDELTAADAIRRFTLPSLIKMNGWERLKILMGICPRWSVYSSDKPLIDALKELAFIPVWSSDNPTGASTSDFRLPSQLFSWNNTDLLDALSGDSQCKYFAPPYLRRQDLHAMLTDLGMQPELTKDSLLQLCVDIESAFMKRPYGSSSSSSSSSSSDVIEEISHRSRKLLRYVKDKDRYSTIPFDTVLAKKVSKVQFVPVQIPVKVSAGGHIEYKADIGRFNSVSSKACGALAFTVMPILDEDISPPLYFFSSLGITTSPSQEMVLKHLLHLTSNGDTLDRWNALYYTLKETFLSIFTYLYDNWKDLTPQSKLLLKASNIVPIGNLLVRPERLFFRLSEDLSPFMHEIPRYYGAHEHLLKELGVRETPSAVDYIQFLHALAGECGTYPLNPNELRAVVAIVHSVSLQQEEEVHSKALVAAIHVPDEYSCLHRASTTVYNDSEWMRSRIATHINALGVHFMHPSISVRVAETLGIPRLTTVLHEKLSDSVEVIGDEHAAMSNAAMCSSKRYVIENIFKGTAAAGALSSMQPGMSVQAIQRKLMSVKVTLCNRLSTLLYLRDSRYSSQEILINASPTMSYLQTDSSSDSNGVSDGVSDGTSDGTSGSYIYVNLEMLQSPITLELAVAFGVCKLLDIPTTVAPSVSYLLQPDSACGLSNLLPMLHICHTNGVERQRGIPGGLLTTADAAAVEMKPFKTFRLAEIIAYEDHTMSADGCTGTGSSGVLRYGRIVSIGDNAGEAGLRRLAVKVGNEAAAVKELLSSAVYSFKSARAMDIVTTSASPSKLPLSLSSSAGIATAGTAATATATSAATALSKISRDELLVVLDSLLTRAGIPVDLKEKSLMTRIIDLESSCKRLDAEVMNERMEVGEANASLTRLQAITKCQICVIHDVTHVLLPCGHTLCKMCLDRMRSKCPFCRTRFSQSVKFFYAAEAAEETATV